MISHRGGGEVTPWMYSSHILVHLPTWTGQGRSGRTCQVKASGNRYQGQYNTDIDSELSYYFLTLTKH